MIKVCMFFQERDLFWMGFTCIMFFCHHLALSRAGQSAPTEENRKKKLPLRRPTVDSGEDMPPNEIQNVPDFPTGNMSLKKIIHDKMAGMSGWFLNNN
jgi:hypothetical protein